MTPATPVNAFAVGASTGLSLPSSVPMPVSTSCSLDRGNGTGTKVPARSPFSPLSPDSGDSNGDAARAAAVGRAWGRPPMTAARRPMGDVSVSRLGNTINVTVPTAAASAAAHKLLDAFGLARAPDVARHEQENVVPSGQTQTTGGGGVTSGKSWRNALLAGTPGVGARAGEVDWARLGRLEASGARAAGGDGATGGERRS